MEIWETIRTFATEILYYNRSHARDLPILRIIITMYLPDHNPPHFHVRYNEFRAIIDIQTGAVTGQMPRRALNLVFEWLDQHKDELMANWQRMENGETLATINPLD